MSIPKTSDSSRKTNKTKSTAERVRLLYDRCPNELVATLLAAAVLTIAVWDVTPSRVLLAWLTILTGVTFARRVLVSTYHHSRPTTDQSARWHRFFSVGAFIAGLTWGAAGLLLIFYSEWSYQLFVLFILGCVALNAYVSMVCAISTLSLFTIPVLLPAACWFAIQGDSLHLSVAALIAICAVLMITSARSVSMVVSRASDLVTYNAELIRKLVSAKDLSEKAKRSAEHANRELQNQVEERRRGEEKIRASRQQLSSILDNMHDTIFRADFDCTIVWISPSVQELLGYDTKDLSGKSMRQFCVSECDQEQFMTDLSKQNGNITNYEMRMVRKDNSEIWVSINCHYYYGSFGDIAGIEGTLRNITARKYAEEALFQEKERALVTLESIGDGVITTDVTGKIQYMNPVAEISTGWQCSEIQGSPITQILRLIDENTRKTVVPNPVRHCLNKQAVVKVEGHPLLVHRNGKQRFSVELSAAPIRDSNDAVIGTVLIFHDVTELRGLARKMSYQAAHDSLTGLINRREFDKRCQTALETEQTSGTEQALCYLDLDQFKVVNDTCGHQAGDELLKQLTHCLQGQLREADTLARLGGDEFGVLLGGCSPENALEIAENLRKTVEEFRFSWDNQLFRVGVSIGLVPITSHVSSPAELLSAADSACYIAKEQGRNRIHVSQPNDEAVAEHHGQMRWTQRIQDALENDKFCLHFQPIIRLDDSANNSELHGEILLRMLDDKGQLILPGAFLPSAERYQLMGSIDHWVVEHTFELLSERDVIFPGIATCSINLSGQSLSDNRFLDMIVYLVLQAGIPPNLICFEITETAMIANLNNATRFISKLRDMGCRFALDDFGSGLSSFSYLKQLPVDFLKLDGSYVRNMINDRTDLAMVRAIHQVGHVMGMQTIAECVEDTATLQALRNIGVDFAQGFAIARSKIVQNTIEHSERSVLQRRKVSG
ncbi:MAG: EAL domain-containing protein [Gammaproteobacteria bacterium]